MSDLNKSLRLSMMLYRYCSFIVQQKAVSGILLYGFCVTYSNAL